MKIVVFSVEDWEKPCFDALADGHEIVFEQESLQEDNVERYADAEIVSLFIYSDASRAVLERMPRLRLIATRSTGFEHIDLEYCKERGITVCNVPAYGFNTVAEHAFGLLLTLSHNLYEAIDRTRKGDFSMQGLRGFDLFGKTLGVVGTGEIGRCVIRIAKGFGMRVLAFDVKPDAAYAQEAGFEYVDLDRLLAESDVVTLHVPSNPKTQGMIGNAQFDRMKKGAVLINTSRGDVVDVQALTRALAEGKVAGVGLDVLPEEPVIREEAELLRSVYQRTHDLGDLLAGHVLMRMRNVVVTPHSAFYTKEAVQRILDTTVENIQAFVAGEPSNVVQGAK